MKNKKTLELVKLLRAERRSRDITLAEMGIRLAKNGKSYSAQNMSHIESGSNIGINTFIKYADALGFEVVLKKY